MNFSINLPVSLHKALRDRASEQDASMTDVVLDALKKYFD